MFTIEVFIDNVTPTFSSPFFPKTRVTPTRIPLTPSNIRTKTVRPICLFCSVMFCGGNAFYALLGLVARTDYKLRVWLMLLARLVVGTGSGEARELLSDY